MLALVSSDKQGSRLWLLVKSEDHPLAGQVTYMRVIDLAPLAVLQSCVPLWPLCVSNILLCMPNRKKIWLPSNQLHKISLLALLFPLHRVLARYTRAKLEKAIPSHLGNHSVRLMALRLSKD